VIITSINDNSPAQKAKLEYGDIIIAVENIKVLSLNDILEIIEVNDIRPGDKIQLKIWRNGRYINRKLKLGKL
jgi:S1-C subfamily serine protease